jgi:metal-responsive CopG/Arc/MetJ family transcriptional regulator
LQLKEIFHIFSCEKAILRGPMRVITFKAEEDLVTKLDLYAINRRISRSEIIREALKKYLEAE